MSEIFRRKLIFFDIDGTLLTEDSRHFVPESAQKALEMLQKKGHICMINTGRPFSALDDVIKSIKVSGYVCGCGTNIRLGDEVLFSYRMEPDFCEKIVRELDRFGFEWMLEGEEALFYSDKKYATGIGRTAGALRQKVPEKIHCVSESDYRNIRFEKFIMTITGPEDFEEFKEIFEEKLAFIDRGNGLYEVIPRQFSKATGMKFLEEHFGIAHEDTIAVGDSSNDVSMLEYAHLSILMGNSDESLHKYADFITTPILEDGIFNAFRHFGLI